MISTFHKDHPEKLTVISPPLDTASPIARPTVNLPSNQKQGRPKKRDTKRAKWGDKEESKSI